MTFDQLKQTYQTLRHLYVAVQQYQVDHFIQFSIVRYMGIVNQFARIPTPCLSSLQDNLSHLSYSVSSTIDSFFDGTCGSA